MFKTLTISLDVDDVLMPCVFAAIEEANRRYGLHLDPKAATDWDFTNFAEADRRHIFEVLNDVAFYEQQVPLPGAVEMVQTLVDWGHDVLFLSAAKSHAMATRACSLRRYFPMVPERNIMLGARKDLVQTDVHLDDAMHNITASPARYPVIMKQLWNMSDARSAGYLSVSSYEEFLALVRQLSQADTPMEKRHTREPSIICLVGPSGSGKKALAKELVKNPAYCHLKSCTTRPRYPGESDDLYRFISRDEFEQGREEFIETSVYADHYFGLRASDATETLSSGHNAVILTDITGALKLRQKFGKRTILVFVHRDRYEVISELVTRDMPVADRAKRILSLENEYKNESMCDYAVVMTSSVAEVAGKVLQLVQ